VHEEVYKDLEDAGYYTEVSLISWKEMWVVEDRGRVVVGKVKCYKGQKRYGDLRM